MDFTRNTFFHLENKASTAPVFKFFIENRILLVAICVASTFFKSISKISKLPSLPFNFSELPFNTKNIKHD